jgi:hypothetical protein
VPDPHVAGVHLVRGPDRTDALTDPLGARVGIDGLLDDLSRTARVGSVPARAAVSGFRWCDEDYHDLHWFPQGITSSADQSEREQTQGRRVLCTSWYSHHVGGRRKGSRVTFIDITDETRVRYQHVLLVQAAERSDDGEGVVPVPIHAGGLVWHGPYLHVAATARGIYSFRVDDIVRVHSPEQTYGYRYVLPLRFTYDAHADEGVERLRYSFLSLDRSVRPHQLVAGEYGARDMSTRLVSFEVDPATSLLSLGDDERTIPLTMHDAALRSMQGATVVDDTYYVTTSAGRRGRGSLWAGRLGGFRRFARVLPVGPEDITYWPSTGRLWSLTEYPGARHVFAMNRSDFG